MPGLSFVYTHNNSTEILRSFSGYLEKTRYLDTFTTQILSENSHHALGFTSSFPEYPMNIFENEHYKIWMEGFIYNIASNQISDHFFSICESLFKSKKTKSLLQWLNSTDGEFFVFLYDKWRGNWCIFRDILGRLPVYCYSDSMQFAISRDLRFVRTITSISELDRLGMAQFMLFGYCLQEHTFYKNVKKVKPSMLFQIDSKSNKVFTTRLREFDYSDKRLRYRSTKENASQLAEIFKESCKNRASLFPKRILKLSGGYDSRAIAAGLKAAEQAFGTDSWLSKDKKNHLDYTTAKQVANVLELPWKHHFINDCSGKDVKISFLLKSGLNNLRFVYPIRYARLLRKEYGSNTLVFDGLCGDKLMPDLRPQKHLFSFNALVDYTIRNNRIWNLNTIEYLMDVSQKDILSSIEETLSAYPEKPLCQKYVHWCIHERAMRRFFEAEDRSRSFFWTGTPFLNPAFHDYAMSCPDTQKSNRFLYTVMLSELFPEVLEVPYARNNATVPEPIKRYVHRSFHYQKKVRHLTETIYNRLISPIFFNNTPSISLKTPTLETEPSVILECINKQSENPKVSNYFSVKAFREIVTKPEKHSDDQLGHLFTLMTVIEEFHSDTITIEKYNNCCWD
jgi:asparagine synthase (glutamine-hydrolysing)